MTTHTHTSRNWFYKEHYFCHFMKLSNSELLSGHISTTSLGVFVFYLDNMAEFGQQSRQGACIIVLQTQPVTKGFAVLCEQLADRQAGVFLSP